MGFHRRRHHLPVNAAAGCPILAAGIVLAGCADHRLGCGCPGAYRYEKRFALKPDRCENRIKTLKACGLGKLPYWSFTANQVWANLAVLAMNLTSWIQLVMLPIGHPARCWDVKRWRYRLYSIGRETDQQ